MQNTENNTAQIKEKRAKESKNIPLNEIVADHDFNIRVDYGDIEGLMNDIIENGQKEPVTVVKIRKGENKGKYKVFKGHRRVKAIQMANEQGHDLPYVWAFSVTMTEEEMVIEMISSDIHKKNHTEIEVAEGMARLLKYGYNKSEIARKTGVTHTTVGNYLLLTKLTKKVRNLIIEKKLKAQDAIRLMKAHKSDAEKVEEIIFAALENITEDSPEASESTSEQEASNQSDETEKESESSKKPVVRTLNANVLGLKPLSPIQKLNKAIDTISERIDEKKLQIKDESKIDTLAKLANQLKEKDTDFEKTINILLELF